MRQSRSLWPNNAIWCHHLPFNKRRRRCHNNKNNNRWTSADGISLLHQLSSHTIHPKPAIGRRLMTPPHLHPPHNRPHVIPPINPPWHNRIQIGQLQCRRRRLLARCHRRCHHIFSQIDNSSQILCLHFLLLIFVRHLLNTHLGVTN